jgi:hypothetical protein
LLDFSVRGGAQEGTEKGARLKRAATLLLEAGGITRPLWERARRPQRTKRQRRSGLCTHRGVKGGWKGQLVPRGGLLGNTLAGDYQGTQKGEAQRG